MQTCIGTIKRQDGKARVDFFDHGDGLYSFEESQELVEEVPEIGPYTYWSATYGSGLYNDLALAEREARAVIPWYGSDTQRE